MDVRSFGTNLVDPARRDASHAAGPEAEDAYYRRHAGTTYLLPGIQSAMVALLAVVALGWIFD
jgi:hypothetical protein